MYGNIVIKTASGSAQFRTNAYDSIYDYLRYKGYSHEEAEEVASWAPEAPYGDEYELDEAEITIVEP